MKIDFFLNKCQIWIHFHLTNSGSSHEQKKLGQNSFYGQNDLLWPWLSTMVVDQKMVKIEKKIKKISNSYSFSFDEFRQLSWAWKSRLKLVFGQNDLFWPWLSTMVVDQKKVKIEKKIKKNIKFVFIFIWRIQGALMSLKSSVQTRFTGCHL